MKVRIQSTDGFACEREVTERGARSVRVPDIDGHTETFSITTGDILYSVRSFRVDPRDVPGLKSLPLRVAKTKPMDLNAHPLAPVLRRVVAVVSDSIAEIGGDPDYALDAIQDTAIVRDAETRDVLTSCATLALAGLAALDKPEPPCP